MPWVLKALAALAAGTLLAGRLAAAESPADSPRAYASERNVIIAEALQLTEHEGREFWPLYAEYRARQERLGDELVKLVLEYADAYPNVPEAQSARLLKGYVSLEKQLANTRVAYLRKFARVLPASKALRLAQLENRLDVAARLQLASAIPLSPIEGRLVGRMSGTALVAPGIPGGARVQTYELTATVKPTIELPADCMGVVLSRTVGDDVPLSSLVAPRSSE